MSRNLAIIPLFPQTPFTQENEEPRERVTDLLTDSLTTGARARTRTRESERITSASRDEDERITSASRDALECEEAIEQIAEYYCETFGLAVMPPVAKRQCRMAMNQGLEETLIYTAIDEAALAPRPSWAYAAAILRRLCAEGCFTFEAYADRQERWEARRRR